VRPYLKKPFTKIGLVEWLKMKALSSSPNIAKKKKERKKEKKCPSQNRAGRVAQEVEHLPNEC
jgi:hypothetical protein